MEEDWRRNEGGMEDEYRMNIARTLNQWRRDRE